MIPTLELHKNIVLNHADKIKEECESGNSSTYYNTSFYLHGLLSGVEASGDEELLRQTIHYLELMINKAVPHVKGGITYQHWEDPNEDPVELDHFQALVPFARAAFLIASHPTWKNSRYMYLAKKLADFARHNGLEYWFDKDHGVYAQPPPWNWVASKIYRLPPDLGGGTPWPEYSPPNPPREWNDKETLAGTLAAWLAATNPQDWFCLDIANRIATAFRRRLTLQNGGWVWDVLQVNWDSKELKYTTLPNHKNTPDHDTFHTNREPQFLIACHQAGIVFTHADLDKMAVALTDRLWNGDIADPAFSNYLTGRNEIFYRDYTQSEWGPWELGTVYLGWAMLGRYNPICRLVMESVLSQVLSPGGQSGKTLGWQHFTRHGEVSMSGHCLLNRKGP